MKDLEDNDKRKLEFKKQEDGTYQIWNVRFNERKYNFYFI